MRKIDPILKICEFCQMDFLTKKKIKRFCSNVCAIRHMCSKKKKGKMVLCSICNKEFYRKRCLIKKTNCCSEECRCIYFKTLNIPYRFIKKTRRPVPKYKTIRYQGKKLLLHRHIMQQSLGRNLQRWEHVHHINHDTFDNRLENLKVLSNREHGKLTTKENPHIYDYIIKQK